MSPWFDSVPMSIRPLLCSSALGRKKRREEKKRGGRVWHYQESGVGELGFLAEVSD